MSGPEGLRCRELVDLVTDYLEGALPPDERAAIEAHVAECGDCSAYLSQVRQTIEIVGTLREDPAPPVAIETLLWTFRAWREGGEGLVGELGRWSADGRPSTGPVT